MSFDDQILREPVTGVVLDLSVAPAWHHAGLPAAVAAMKAIEAGAVANADEGRRVGHYWLRAPDLAPEDAVGDDIRGAWSAIADMPDARRDLAAAALNGMIYVLGGYDCIMVG